MTFRILHKDGVERWVEVAATRVESGDPDAPWELVASARDISKRMNALAALDESQSRLRAVADNMPALIVHIDAEERYTFINAYYERLFGRKPDECSGTRFARREGRRRTRNGRLTSNARSRARSRSSNAIRAVVRRSPPAIAFRAGCRAGGTHRGFYALTFDITPLKEAEQALAKLARVDT